MSKDFELFQSEFKKWQQRFGLTEYMVYFCHKPLGDNIMAEVEFCDEELTVTVSLNSELDEENKQIRDVRADAKHEALHLLVRKLAHCGMSRYVTGGDIHEATEGLVHKLEGLIGE